ncbi:LysR family transcriptional regulator [Roseateles puraquae]|uniref:LysR family transcriptional regulator n=1 Tax=Roseateles puraquae TaxID=431059 RepID=UPI0031D09CD0
MNTAAHRSIDIRQLRYFLVVAEELNFRRAAERLHLTQPPLSRQIAALEAALGVSLLDRSGPGTRLTAAGEQARAAFARAVQAFDAAVAGVAAGEPTDPERLRLGLPWWMDMSAFATLDRAWRDATRQAPLEPLLATGPELLAALLKRTLDAALIAMPHDLQGLRHAEVATLAHVAVVPASSPLARKRALRLADLQDGPVFLRFARRVNPALWTHYQRQYEALGFQPAREADAPGTSATIAQIAAGRGCTLLPSGLARQRYPGVAYRRLLDPVTVQVHLVFREGLAPALVQALTDQGALFTQVLG